MGATGAGGLGFGTYLQEEAYLLRDRGMDDVK
jgi:hypothetical protein